MYGCMDEWKYGCMGVLYACLHACMHASTYVRMYVRMHVCMYASLHVCTSCHGMKRKVFSCNVMQCDVT